MKKTKLFKSLLFVIIMVILSTSLSACFQRKPGGEVIDTSKTQLYVGYYSGGLGLTWLNNAKAAFEAENPTVQVMIDPNKDIYVDTYMQAAYSSMTEDMYILDNCDYSWYKNRNYFADITDIVTEKSGTEKSIADKMDKAFRQFYETKDDKFYALPLYTASYNMVYDKKVFKDFVLYFASGGGFTGDVSKATVGQDGIAGTYDDGLPVTLSDYKKMLDRMVAKGVTPMIYTGDNQTYFVHWLFSVWCDYEGYDNAQMNYTLDGEYTFSGNSSPTKITYENAYELQKQQGKKYALDVMETALSDKDYYRTECFDLVSNSSAQAKFLLASETSNPIGMIVEGTWWENEARPSFNSLVNISSDENNAYGVKEFGIMPIPQADDGSSAKGNTLYGSTGTALMAVREDSKQKDLAKKFMKYLHTEERLQDFTAMTNVPKPYEYSMSEGNLSKMTPLGRETYSVYKDTDFIYNLRNSDYMKYTNYDVFNYICWPMSSKVGATISIFPQEFYKLKKYTKEQIFAGFYDFYDKDKWSKAVADYKKDWGTSNG